MRIYNSRKDFNVNDFDEASNIESAINSNIAEQPSTPCAAKRAFIDIKCESLTDVPSLKKIDLKQEIDAIPLIVANPKIEIKLEEFDEEIVTATDINNTEQVDDVSLVVTNTEIDIDNHKSETFTEETATTSAQRTISKNSKRYIMKKKLRLRPYRRSKMFSLKFNSSIYKDAIKKIDIIDSSGSFINSVLDELNNLIEGRSFERSSLDFSKTYSNMSKYILRKISPCIDDIMSTADVLITPGMSISNIKYNCVLNHLFFEKLREICENTIKDIRVAPDDYLFNIFQKYIIFNYCSGVPGRIDKFFIPSKSRSMFFSKLKELIIETIYNLPRSIIWEIENFDRFDIVNSLFSDFHGVLLSKPSIRDLNYFFNSNKNKVLGSNFADNLDLFNDLFEKIGNLVRKSCIFYEGEVFLPDKSMTEMMSKYLLSDMYGVPPKFHKELKLSSGNILELRESSSFAKVGIQLPKLYMNTTDALAVNTEVKICQEHNYCKTLQEEVSSKELKLKRYYPLNSLCYTILTGFAGSIYECAIKKMNIDSNGLFKNSVLDELDDCITSKGISRSSIDISRTYLNVRGYISGKISPYINDIIATEDILITSGMSIYEIRNNCIHNYSFFKKLHEKCEKIVEGIIGIIDEFFLNIIQTRINLGSDSSISIFRRRNKFCPKIKSLIIETISNLPQSIIFEIENLEQSDIIKGLFLDVHGILISKYSVRNIISFLNYEKNKFLNAGFKDNRGSFNDLFEKLREIVETSAVLSEEKVIHPTKYTARVLSEYLLLDVFGSHFKFHKDLQFSAKNIEKVNPSSSSKVFNLVNDNYSNLEMRSLKNDEFIPKSNSKWNPDFVKFLNIYELAASMIDIDEVEFEDYLLNKIKLFPSLALIFDTKSRIKFNLSVTYRRIKNYIFGMLIPFLEKNEKETKVKIKLRHGITLEELEYAYISNEVFFSRLSAFCAESIRCIKNIDSDILNDMIQYSIPLEIEGRLEKVKIRKRRRVLFNEGVSQILINTMSSMPERIVSSIKMLPRSKLVGEYFSSFHNIYVDNESLLKMKPIFNYINQKVLNDKILSKAVNKVCSDIIYNFGDGKGISLSRIHNIINSHIVYKKLSIFRYIKKLVREELYTVQYNIVDSVMIILHDKVEMADKKMKGEILYRLESDLIAASVGLYRNLCLKSYRDQQVNNNE